MFNRVKSPMNIYFSNIIFFQLVSQGETLQNNFQKKRREKNLV